MTMQRQIISNPIRNFILFPILWVGHLFYTLGIGHWLFGLAGGITRYPDGRWTRLGGIDWAFEIPLFTPGSYFLTKSNIGPCMWDGSIWSLLFLGIASILIILATGQLIQKVVNKDSSKFGKFYWRLIVVILGWTFIPVPVEMTLTYNFTVLC